MAAVTSTAPLRCGPALSAAAFAHLRKRMIFEWNKLDPQNGDRDAFADFPIILSAAAWQELRRLATELFFETMAAEAELAMRPEMHGRLGLPGALRRALRAGGPSARAPRVIRFDFHLTREGWRISEANTDVPGGFIEAAGLTALVAEFGSFGVVDRPPFPGPALALAHARLLGKGATIALVHASAFTDDRQVMQHLAVVLAECGLTGLVVAPDRLDWSPDSCRVAVDERPVDAIIRFFPAEWLPHLARSSRWMSFFRSRDLPQCNPPAAVLVQSKRFPLLWDSLRTPLRVWRRSLLETRDPADVRIGDPEWILKPALGRVGEGVLIRGVTAVAEARKIDRWARWFPRGWAAQRRFEAVAIESDHGLVYPSLGVFVIDGEVAGIYGRVADRPLIDQLARDCAVLIEAPEPVNARTEGWTLGSAAAV